MSNKEGGSYDALYTKCKTRAKLLILNFIEVSTIFVLFLSFHSIFLPNFQTIAK